VGGEGIVGGHGGLSDELVTGAEASEVAVGAVEGVAEAGLPGFRRRWVRGR
jgi:hypothetical protein